MATKKNDLRFESIFPTSSALQANSFPWATLESLKKKVTCSPVSQRYLGTYLFYFFLIYLFMIAYISRSSQAVVHIVST